LCSAGKFITDIKRIYILYFVLFDSYSSANNTRGGGGQIKKDVIGGERSVYGEEEKRVRRYSG
jgi:hypothetical protein